MITQRQFPIRVAHVLAGMVPAGLETWLIRVLRHIDRSRFHLDFITHLNQECYYDREIEQLGSRVIRCTPPSRPWQYAHSFRHVLAEHGPYDIVHSHLHHFSGFVLRLADRSGIPVRIAHSHSDTRMKQTQAGLARRWYLRTTERWLSRHATHGLAVSEPAGAALFPTWKSDGRWQVLYCGIELDPFRAPLDRAAVRGEFGLPADAMVMGHVGTFREPKNHRLLLEIAAAVMARDPSAWLLMVGEGELRAEIEARIQQLGIADRVVLTGFVEDPLRIVRGAMDVFVFPSLWEGLPLAVIEAQAAGLPCVLSDVIADEVSVVESLVEHIPLSATPELWAERVLHRARETDPSVRRAALAQIEASPFNIETCVRHLESIYAAR